MKIGKEFKILTNQNHLSYPYTFKRNNFNYFIQRIQIMAQIHLIKKCLIKERKSFRAIKIRKLFDGYAIDPSLVRKDGIDYLFVSSD